MKGTIGDRAHLETALYVSSASKCKMSLWYNMNGREMGDLNVYLKTERGEMKKLWSRSGEQGKEWKQVSGWFKIIK